MSVQQDESHPVLGRSRTLRNAAERRGLICLDSAYRGLKEKHRFACEYGHVTRISPRNLIRRWKLGCRECTQIAATERMYHLAKKADSICVNAKWRGTAAQCRFRCNAGHTWSCPDRSLLRSMGVFVSRGDTGERRLGKFRYGHFRANQTALQDYSLVGLTSCMRLSAK